MNMEHYKSGVSENDPSSFEALLDLLEFPRTSELVEARRTVLQLLQDPTSEPEAMQAAWILFADAIEFIVENPDLDAPTHTKLHIGAIIYKALVFKEVGNHLRYAQELDDAELYSSKANVPEISEQLGVELKSVIETLPLDTPEIVMLKLRDKIIGDDRMTLLDSIYDGDDFDDVLGTAYGMLLENGFDPDDVMNEVGLTE